MFKALDYGGGVDLWNVPLAQYRLFVKVSSHPVEIKGAPELKGLQRVIPQH